MKKLKLFICVFILITLCGCTGYRETERGYLVTAIGFRKDNGKVEISLETLTASDTAQNSESGNILYGAGQNLTEAYYSLKSSLLKDVYYEHCGVIVVENSFDEEETVEILTFCRTLQSLGIGVYVVKSDNVSGLFETRILDESVGYGIIGLIKNAGQDKFSNKLYQIEKNQAAQKTFVLPKVNAKNNILILE